MYHISPPVLTFPAISVIAWTSEPVNAPCTINIPDEPHPIQFDPKYITYCPWFLTAIPMWTSALLLIYILHTCLHFRTLWCMTSLLALTSDGVLFWTPVNCDLIPLSDCLFNLSWINPFLVQRTAREFFHSVWQLSRAIVSGLLMYFIQAVFLHCFPDCPSYPANAI